MHMLYGKEKSISSFFSPFAPAKFNDVNGWRGPSDWANGLLLIRD
jgi:hypothetical protein